MTLHPSGELPLSEMLLMTEPAHLSSPLFMFDIFESKALEAEKKGEDVEKYLFCIEEIDLIALDLSGNWVDGKNEQTSATDRVKHLFTCYTTANSLSLDKQSGAHQECLSICKGSITTAMAILLEAEPLALVPFLIVQSLHVPKGFCDQFAFHLMKSGDEDLHNAIFGPILRDLIKKSREYRLLDNFGSPLSAIQKLTGVPSLAELAVLECWVLSAPQRTEFVEQPLSVLQERVPLATFPLDEMNRMTGRDLIWTFLGSYMDISSIGDQNLSKQFFSEPSKRVLSEVMANTQMLRHRLGLLKSHLAGIGLFFYFESLFLIYFTEKRKDSGEFAQTTANSRGSV